MRKPIGTFFLFLLVLSTCTSHHLRAQCNGDPALCNKRFDEVCYATTHNAFNYQGPFFFPNQSFDIAQQMTDGVRSLMLDVYWYNNAPTVYHSSNWLGNQPLANLLTAIKDFLDAHPNEVMSIIFESYITASQMADAFTQAGLLPYLHAQPQGASWPTLGDMIAANQRLVIFTDVNDGQAFPWYHYVWDFAVETNWENHSRTDFSCAYNRGDSTKSLFILNHFISDATFGYGLIDSAAVINANPYLSNRAMGCWAATGKIPNFLTVDFHEQGDVMAAKDNLNAGLVGDAPSLGVGVGGVRVVPNPVQDQICLYWQGNFEGECKFSLYDLQGRLQLHSQTHVLQNGLKVSVPERLENGTYFYQVDSKKGPFTGKLVILR